MASLLPDFEYDIFISYRQKDNEYDGWVTEFVNNLKRELHATFKEDISIYFDSNPIDGLLETHIVDESLVKKLKCLILIPVISQTYCDPQSFAWQHELVAFNKLAKEDQFGRDICLAGGNVASRILPVKIHDLDPEDKTLLENELGGILRSIDFIYKASGVNRPLKPNDERAENLNHTYYRDQINKVANAVKEILTAIKKPNQQDRGISREVSKPKPESPKKLKVKIITGSLLVLVIIALGYFFIPKLSKNSEPVEKTIAVLPFRNLSNDTTQLYFCDGFMAEILNDLQKVKSFTVRSRTSSDQYRDTKKSSIAISNELNVNYLVEGSVEREGNNLKIWVQLIDSKADKPVWSNDYPSEMKQLFSLQSEIAKDIATELKAILSPEEIKKIDKKPTENLEAYNAFLKGEFYRKIETKNDLETSMRYYKIALEKDPDYAIAYCGIADLYRQYLEMGYLSPSEGMPKEHDALMTAQKLDSTLAEVHYGLAMFKTYSEWDWKGGESEFKKAIIINPNNAEALASYSQFLNRLGRTEEAMEQIKLALKLTPYDPFIKEAYGMILLKAHRYNEAIDFGREALKIDSISGSTVLYFALHLTGRHDEALKIWKKAYYVAYPGFVHAFDEGYSKAGYIGALSFEADTLFAQSKTAYVNPGDIAILYVCAGNKKRALDCLERAFEVHDVNLKWIPMPIFDSLRNEPRFQALCRKINLPIK